MGKMHRAETLEDKRASQSELASVLAYRTKADASFTRIAMLAMGGDNAKAQEMIDSDPEEIEDVDCHAHTLQVVAENCGPFTDYTMRYSRLFANLCNAKASPFVNFDNV